jgi:hypothetical protein
MKNFNWKKLDIIDSDGDHPAIPALCGFLYFTADIHIVAKELANGIERYVELVGLDVLKSYVANSGDWKPMTKSRLDRDLKHLRNFPKDHIAVEIEYDAAEGGEPGNFGLYIDADEEDEDFEKRMSLFRFDFPAQWLEEHDVDQFIEFISNMVQLPHVQSAHVGYTFKSTSGSVDDAIVEVHKKLPRYLGFSPCDFELRYEMLGKTFTAHWLNYVNDDLAASVGGPNGIAEALPNCDVRRLKKGVLIRGAKLPPIGDRNRKAPDIGNLPEVARLLKPTRLEVEETYFATGNPDFDAVKWIERMDDSEERPWDNSKC